MGILDGKIAIITGAGQGLGEGAAHAMTQEGACVALWGRTFEKVERVANDINKAGGRALAIKCDVSIRAEVDEALKKTIEAFGKLDILATNHFAFAPYGTMEDTPLETWDYEYRNNVIGTVNCMQACFPYLKETGKDPACQGDYLWLRFRYDWFSHHVRLRGLQGGHRRLDPGCRRGVGQVLHQRELHYPHR